LKEAKPFEEKYIQKCISHRSTRLESSAASQGHSLEPVEEMGVFLGNFQDDE
jgi:hypothetical protein